jgi:hypothetical protein
MGKPVGSHLGKIIPTLRNLARSGTRVRISLEYMNLQNTMRQRFQKRDCVHGKGKEGFLVRSEA